ncbi:MAG TPA: hypothetical protein PK970_09305 [Hyphomicrobiaceae bacterium]|nr:hypothetical protein [Hyphomicrobiaceae bacterium]
MSRHYSIDDGGALVLRQKLDPAGITVQHTTGSVILTYDSSSADPRSLTRAFVFLARTEVRRVVLRDVAEPGPLAHVCSRQEALRVLSNALERRTARPKFSRLTLPIDASFFAERWPTALTALLATKRPEDAIEALDRLFNGTYALMTRERADDLYVAAVIGSGIRAYTQRTGFIKLGEPFRMLPATEYGQWIDEGFSPVTPDRGPSAETIDATVGFGRTAGMRLSYQRLVLPFARGGRDYILTASVIA